MRQLNTRVEDGIRTRDLHLGKVVFSVLRVNFTPLPYCSVHQVSTPSAASAPVVERSTMRGPSDIFLLRTPQHPLTFQQCPPQERRDRPRRRPTSWQDIMDPHIGGIRSDHRSSSPISPETSAPAVLDMGTRPHTIRRSCSAVPRICTDAARGSRLTVLPPRSERSSHQQPLRSLHSKLIVGPGGASCAARDAATNTSRNSSTPSAAICGVTEKSCPCAASVSQRWTTDSNAIRRAHQPTQRPDTNHDQHSSSTRTLDSCSSSDAVPERNHSTNSGESFGGVRSSANRPKSASGRPRTTSATT